MSEIATFIPVDEWIGKAEVLDAVGGLPQTHHVHDEPSLHAINAALAAGRPLLVRGEPGTGKSQLARAAAKRLGRRFVWRVMDVQARVSDLFYSFDAVERLAQAQVAGALCAAGVHRPHEVAGVLAESNFIRPGPLWWAFDAGTADAWPNPYVDTGGPSVEVPYVVLIDEIDKTDPSVPNGLLEALGQGTFPVRRSSVSLHHNRQQPPLVVITTNNERELPGAFVRRCMVHQIEMKKPGQGLEQWLEERGRTHFPKLAPRLLREAAELLCEDREAARELGIVPPGQAEYLDLLRAVGRLGRDEGDQRRLLEKIADFALKKHPELREPEESAGHRR
ncbi:MAG: MoxR family ATPase [Deltaproteobacteria bacterium]|nr:MoxR family ATPase [Deltaproteobacteria bacterium]